ncbi:uncharacterized protein LOC103280372 isoform X2 [Anolis carolinensis]|uniref:Ricin B lectin domain-containing protein n=1 Tax=Anolis carolinensis TaxID=28377 RepID=A0A803SZB4_ANOCA
MGLFKSGPNWTFLLLWLQASGGESFLIKNSRLGKCIHVFPHAVDQVGLSECKPHSLHHQWRWNLAVKAVVSLATKQCLSVSHPEEFALAQLAACEEEGSPQGWACSQKGHLTLQGSGLHLTTKPGGHKAFLSKEKDKFSRWKTLTDKIVCAGEPDVMDPGFGDQVEESLDPLEWVPESKSTASLELHMTFSVEATTVPPATIWEDFSNITSTFSKNEDGDFVEDQGTNWKTVMLVLSPVAFILGLVILLLNIHYNRKKKRMLSALKSRQVRQEEGLSLPGTPASSPKVQVAPAFPSPSLKHGEILIEWKDGTITPLFDGTSEQRC